MQPREHCREEIWRSDLRGVECIAAAEMRTLATIKARTGLQGRRSFRPVVFSTGVHRRTGVKWGPIMAGMGYRRSRMEHCPEEGLAPRRTEEVECLAASEGARFGDHRRAGRLQRRLPLAAYRLLRRPSPSSLCGSGPIMAGYRCSQMEHCREDGSCDVQRRDAEPERRGLWRPSGRGPGCGFVCLCRRAVFLSVHRRCAGPKRS